MAAVLKILVLKINFYYYSKVKVIFKKTGLSILQK